MTESTSSAIISILVEQMVKAVSLGSQTRSRGLLVPENGGR